MRYSSSSGLILALPVALAQTFTDCDPTKESCPDDLGLPSKHFDFAGGNNASWSPAYDGAESSISDATNAPTIETDFTIFFGRVEVEMKASPGTGIISAIVMQSKNLDEIDWEFLGGDTEEIQTNFCGKGNTTTWDRGGFQPLDTPQEQFYAYTFDWASERMEWSIDGTVVRTVPYDDPIALNGRNYPQTPMHVKLGSWCAGCSTNSATVRWAGGETKFDKDPFTMFVRNVKITSYNPGSKYNWTDSSGSWESIEAID